LLEVARDFTLLPLLQRQALIAPAASPGPAPLPMAAARSAIFTRYSRRQWALLRQGEKQRHRYKGSN
jgi:hypothetical protein